MIIDNSYRQDVPSSKGEWNLILDKRWSERLGISEGNKFTAVEFCKLIKNKMGNITDMYKENPEYKIQKKRDNLIKGLEFYLKNK